MAKASVRSSSTAKQTGTTCGSPLALAVARCATRAASRKSRSATLSPRSATGAASRATPSSDLRAELGEHAGVLAAAERRLRFEPKQLAPALIARREVEHLE